MTVDYSRTKILYCAMAIGLMMGGLVPCPAAAEDEYYIVGTITEDGSNDPIPNNEISITNLRTNETEYVVSNSTGWYEFALDDFDFGWLSGDKIMLLPGYIDASHEGYPVRFVLDSQYPAFTWTVHLIVSTVDSPIPPDPPIGYSIGNMYVINRESSNDDIVCNVPNGWHCDIPSNDYEYVRLLAGYFMYDDGYSDFPQPQPEGGYDYTVTYCFWFELFKTSDNQMIGNASSNSKNYDTYEGDDTHQLDPLFTINLQDSYDEVSLWARMQIWVQLYNKDTQTTEYSDFYSKSITGIRFDWPD